MEIAAPKRMDQLQFFRFFAFFWIFSTHTVGSLGMYVSFIQDVHTTAMQGGVYFFFVLSGFLKGYSSFQKEITLSVGAIWNDLWGKLKKLYPIYFAVYLFYAIGTGSVFDYFFTGRMLEAQDRGRSYLEHLFLVQAWDKQNCIEYNYVAWFLSVLMFLVLLDVPVTKLYQRWEKKENAGLIFGGLTVAFLAIEFVLRIKTSQMEPYYNLVFPPCRIPEYVGGITMGYFVRSIYPTVAKAFRFRLLWTVAEILAVAYIISAAFMGDKLWGILLLHWEFPVFLLIFVFAFGGGYVSRLLRLPPLPQLGNLVFPCYIMHPLVISIVTSRYLLGTEITPSEMNALFVYTILILLAMSYIITYVIPGELHKSR